MITQKTIETISNKIVQEFKPEKIILFGSYAWGKPNEDSDVDLFVIKETENSGETARKIDNSLWRRDVPLDIVVYSPERIELSIKKGNFFIKNIMAKGKVLYAK